MVSEQLIERIKEELERDKKIYLQNCKDNYDEYVKVAQILFKEYYDNSFQLFKKNWDPYNVYISKAIKLKEAGLFDEEKKLLIIATDDSNTDTPYAYERLAIIYSKEKNYKKAYDVCRKWFNSIYWKIPNMATTSLGLLDRMEKLEKKLTI